jgi:amino acid transporter
MAESLVSNIASGEPSAGSLKSGTAGVPTIIAMVIAAAAPITCTVTLIPLGILLGNGVGTPGAIVLVTAILTLFAVGFVRVLPYIKNTGAFYAYITAGLGRPLGLVSAYALTAAYIALGASVIGAFGYMSNYLLNDYFGWNVAWWVCAVVGVALGTLMTTLGVAIQGRILLFILAVEIMAIVVLDVAILAQNGIHSYTPHAFNPSDVFSGAVGVAGIYAFSLFLGFEGTAVYIEEAKAPERSVPRATYWVIGIIGVFHTLSSWSLIAGGGGTAVQGTIAKNPQLFTFGLSDQYVGHGWTNLIMIFNLLSLFAGILAFQNAAGRYGFALARDDVFPRAFGNTHRKYGTPVVSLFAVGLIYIVLTLVYRIANLDPVLQMATSLVGLGTIGLIALLALAAVSVGVFFVRRGDVTVAKVWAPFAAAVLLAYCGYEGIANYSAITGVPTWWINHLYWLYVPLVLAGFGYVLWVRRTHAERYEQIGQTRL